MKIAVWIRPLAVGLLVVGVTAAVAQDWAGRGRLNGLVVDPEGNPLEGVLIELHPAADLETGPEPLYTNKKGRWEYLGLAQGGWTVQLSLEGFMPSEGTVSVNEFGVNPQVKVTLRPIPEEVLEQARKAATVEQLEEGNRLLAEGQLAAARAQYEEALGVLEAENHPPILMGIARTYYQEDNVEGAIETLEKLLAIDPENVVGLKLISELLIAEGREQEAQVYLAKLPEGEILDAAAYLNVAIDLYNRGELDDALIEFERVVANFPDNPDGYYYRGLVHLNKGENEKAAADFNKYLELAPEGSRVAEVQEFLKYLQPEG